MSTDRLDQLAEQARTTATPVIGGWLRRRAAWRIWSRATPDAMARLARLVVDTDDPKLRQFVLGLLGSVTETHRVDAIVGVWSATRHADLGDLLRQKRWLASEPLPLRVLSALWSDLGPDMTVAPPSGVPALLAAAEDADTTIASRAAEVLRSLARADSRQAVCSAFIDTGSEPARAASLAAGYEPAVPARRAIFCFLTAQWDKYEAIDFDGSALRAAFELAGPSLRQRLADVARRAGRIDYVSAVAREGRRVGELTDHEWESAVEVLAGGGRTADLWRLAQSAPPAWAARIVLRLCDAVVSAGHPEPLQATTPAPKNKELADLAPSARAWLEAPSAELAAPAFLDGHPGGVRAMVVSADGQVCVTAAHGDRVLRIWTLADGCAMNRQAGDVVCLATSVDGRTLAAGATDGTVTLWGLPEGRQIARLAAHVGAVRAMAALPTVRTRADADVAAHDGPALVTAGDDGRVRLFTLPVGNEIRTLGRPAPPIEWLSVDTGSAFVAACDEAGVVKLWDAGRPGVDPLWSAAVGREAVGLAFADGGRTLVCAAKHSARLRLFRCPLGRPVYEASPGGGDCTALLAPAAGRLVCAVGEAGRATLLRAADGVALAPLSPAHAAGITAIAASPDGHLLATGDADGNLHLWGLPDGRLLASTRAGDTPVIHLAFAPGGGPLLAACRDASAVLHWAVEQIRLGRVPLTEMSLNDLHRARRLADADPRGPTSSMAFVAAMLQRRFADDVLLDEVTGRIEAGEFDIELA